MAYVDHFPPLTFDDMARAVTAGLGDYTVSFPQTDNSLPSLDSLPALDSTVTSDQSIIAQWGAPTQAQLNSASIPWGMLVAVVGGIVLFSNIVGSHK